MDEFGVLVESIGFKAHGRSAPMAELKNKPKSNFTVDSSIGDASSVDSFSLPVEELDGIFRSNYGANKTRESQNSFGGDDIFGGPVPSSNQYGGIDLESVLNSSIQNKGSGNSNLTNSIGPNAYDDLLGLESKHGDPVGGSFDGFEVHSSGKQETKGSGFEDLIPGFGGASPSNQGPISKTNLPQESKGHSSKTRSTLGDDPFLVFETCVSQSDATWSYVGPSEEEISKGSVQSALDELDDFSMGDGHNGAETDVKRATSNKASRGTASNESENVDNLDEFFSGGAQQNDAARSTSTKDSQFDIFFHEEKGPEGKQTSSWSSCSTKKVSSTTNMGDDFTALFGDVTTSSGEFHEIEGEPEERRKARLNRHIRTNARIAEALAEKNQRDLQNQQEQEEKRRLAETVDSDIRRWAAGKEGNMRALLSSLHQVLWPECGWRPVTLADMITSDSVKRVYKKATLCVHPDKVQQKGANLQQKYVAEKVFDLLKEAWKKFGAEELR